MNATRDTLSGGESAGSVIGDVLRGWDRFWFSRMDPTTLCFIRLFCGFLTFYVHLTYSWDLLAYIGPEGWIDHDLAGWILREAPAFRPGMGWDDNYLEWEKGNYYWSIFHHVTTPSLIIAIHVFFLVNMLLFALGLATRYTGAISWMGAMSYVQRSNSTVFGLDTMMLILLFYLQIGPSGATLSLDRLISKWWARRKGRPIPEVEPSYAANFTIRLMQVHFCIIYLASGTSKLLGSTWWSGTSMNLVMLNASFAPMNSPLYVYLMKTLATHRWVWETFMSFNILFSVLLEISFSFLVWDRRWRWVMICAAVMLHTGIAVFMGLTTFSLMMIIFLASFIPPEIIARLVDNVVKLLDRVLKPNPQTKTQREGELVMSR